MKNKIMGPARRAPVLLSLVAAATFGLAAIPVAVAGVDTIKKEPPPKSGDTIKKEPPPKPDVMDWLGLVRWIEGFSAGAHYTSHAPTIQEEAEAGFKLARATPKGFRVQPM